MSLHIQLGLGEGELSPELEPLSVLEEGAHSPVLEPLNAHDPQELLDPEEDAQLLRQVSDGF